jgi:putative methyltransferase
MFMNVLISVPTYPLSGMRYLPMVWACLKSHHENLGRNPKSVNWLLPLKNSLDVENFEQSDQTVDVLGVSNYMWNASLNKRVIKLVKEKNPNCFIVCGGPEFDSLSLDSFEDIDCYVPIEGEAAFSEILDNLIENKDWRESDGIIYRDGDNIITKPKLPYVKDWFYSPLLENKEFMEQIVKENAELGLETLLQFETTRGCPYACTFCDWGGGIHTKIRQRPIETLKEEITWTGKNKIFKYFITDANFGILKRDVEVAKHIVETKKEYGYPKGIIYQSAKNQTEQVVDVADVLYNGNMTSGHMISVQSTDDVVLNNIMRSNLPTDKQKIIASKLRERGVPVKSQIIVGLPGDDLIKLKRSVADLYEMGVSREIENFIFGLFPNAPAAEPAYKEKYKLKTIMGYSGIFCRDVTTGQGYSGRDLAICNGIKEVKDESLYGDELWSEIDDKSELVISTISYNEQEWAEMFTWLGLFNGLVEMGLFKFIADFYRHKGVSYVDFLATFIEDLETADPVFANFKEHIYQENLKLSLNKKDYAEVLLPGENQKVGFESAVAVQAWLAGNKEHIRKTWPSIIQNVFGYHEELNSLFDYGLDIMLGYDIVKRKTVSYDYNWKTVLESGNFDIIKTGTFTYEFKNYYIDNFLRLETEMNMYYYALCLVYGRARKKMTYNVNNANS